MKNADTPETNHAAFMSIHIDSDGVPTDFARQLERQRNALRNLRDDAAELLAEIMRDEVNPQDEAEKWLRAYAPQHLFPQNAIGEARADNAAPLPPVTL